MSESSVICVIAVVGAGLAALGALAWIRLSDYRRTRRRGRPNEEFPAEPLARYRPMARLLAGEDADFLRGKATCPKVVDRWERSRRRIVRLYLKELAVDFQCLHGRARVLVAESPEQYSALMPLLFRQQIIFWRTLVLIELRLTLGGLSGSQSGIEKLLGTIEAMQREISRATAMSAA